MKIGRNDECPCKSGRKYKKCHMKKFIYPQESFYVVTKTGNVAPNYHMEKPQDSDEWIPSPGRLYMRIKYDERSYDDIDELFKKFKTIVPTENQLLETILKERMTRLKHKLYGVKYHSENFLQEEDKRISQFEQSYKGTDHEMVMINPRLLYEIESYLFQISSCLDVLTQIISIVYKFMRSDQVEQGFKKINTFTDNGDRLIQLLRNNVENKIRKNAETLADVIEKNRVWIADTIDMRNDVTHFSDLEGFSCFIQEAWEGGNRTRVWYPSMPDGQRAKKYVEYTWKQLIEFLNEVIPLIHLGN
jgi:uncharacterized protein YchJ